MKDKEMLESILSLTKSLCTLYINGTIESVNKKVTTFMNNGLDTSLDLQHELFINMQDAQMYNIENISAKKITQELNKLTSQ